MSSISTNSPRGPSAVVDSVADLGAVVIRWVETAIVISALLILVPLFALPSRRQTAQSKLFTAIYFTCLGLSYLFLEMAMIQALTLFLAHPIYSVSGSIAAFLIFSGWGSLYFQQQRTHNAARRLLWLAVGGIAGLSLIYIFLLPNLFSGLAGAGLFWKLMITCACIVPLAFCMGIPFPFGMRRVYDREQELVPWAYGINGCASVLSSLIATCIAIPYGFRAVMVCAAGLYLLAAGVSHRLGRG